MKFVYTDGTVYQNPPDKDPMHRAFLHDLCLRPSCHHCAFCVRDRQSDITLADFWGIENVLPGFDDGKGVSLVVGHTTLGKQIISELIQEGIIHAHEVDYEKAIAGNRSMTSSVIAPLGRNRFMRSMAKTNNFPGVVLRFTRNRSALRQFLGKVRRRLFLKRR